MGLFGTSDKEAENWITKHAQIYVNESLRNYRTMRRNGSTEKQALENIKQDLRKRNLNV